MAIAPDGSLWLALEQGLCHFDGGACEIYSEADGLTGSDVYALAVAPDGTVWVGSGQGVSRFDGASWTGYSSPVATHDLAVSARGEIWAATAGGVGRYLPAEDGWITYTEDHGLPIANAPVIAAVPSPPGGTGGGVWAHLAWKGVYRWDGTRWQKVEGVSEPILDLAIAPDGTPWVATAGGLHYPGGSLSYHDGSQWHDVARDQGLHSFRSIALGADGLVAASTQLGLGLYDGGEWRLLRDGPTSERVTSVAVTPASQADTGGAAWFAFGDHSPSTPGGGLSRFDGQTWDYHLGAAEVNALAIGPSPQGGPGATLWAGVGCSVQRFDGAAWETVARCEDLPTGNILDIDVAPDGSVWVANGFGLARFDGQSWTVYEWRVHALTAAPDGAIWMNGWEGTQGSSYVARLDASARSEGLSAGRETRTVYKAADSFPGGFAVQAVTPDGLLWGTTPEGRLASFDGRSWIDGESWALYDPPAAWSIDHVAVLAAAPDGALWLAADAAIARFDPAHSPDEAWTLYTQDDGLPARHHRAIAFGPEGEVWLGATRFHPAQP
jgi:hypothetical protein